MSGSAKKYNKQVNFGIKRNTYTFLGASSSSDAIKSLSLILKRSAMHGNMDNKEDETL
jgi:hypothetical protein